MQTKLLSVPEVARVLNIKEDRAYKLIRAGNLPSVRIGRLVRVDESKLQKWIESGGYSEKSQY
ncbi:helix-turn-helix domain-containing protein [Niallia endozanthoxylica]|uniref:Helix-turn-helix domain-containing protein n=1 Tax=Niallia endozanthoxylica TaxID=2036016 RepID=A0A5J5GXU6_9BACI|nr:helix-turn-helix domain-containing protein [Niallia endozanthoxylica]KAA9012403.1 helix-turn-helix domain-containing protein [Niallia endozanthoxylica]